jgi:ribonuclease HI
MSVRAFYAVAVGRVPGIYADYPSCQEQVIGFPRAVHQKFFSRVDAEAFVAAGGRLQPLIAAAAASSTGSRKRKTPPAADRAEPDGNEAAVVEPPPAKKTKRKTPEKKALAELKRRADVDASFALVAKLEQERNALVCYTDGSALENPEGPSGYGFAIQRATADRPVRAGRYDAWQSGFLGVGGNNRAELIAIDRCLKRVCQLLLVERVWGDTLPTDVHILTDNQWSYRAHAGINKITMYVEHLQAAKETSRRLEAHGVHVHLHWITGHEHVPGNDFVDELAKAGAMGEPTCHMPRPADVVASKSDDIPAATPAQAAC